MFIKRRNRYVFMDAAGDGGGGAGGSAGGDGGAGGGAAPDAGAGSTDPASLLATGADGSAVPGEFIPEKFRTNKEDGTFDIDASARKMAEAYGHVEKRIGSGDIPPKTAEEYAVTIPEAFKEVWKPEEDDSYKDFRTKAHAAGMTQKQLDLVMGQYFEMAPKLVAGAAIMDANTAKAELQKTWATPADFQRNVGNAYAATNAIAAKAGMTVDEIMQSPLGNNPQFLRLMAVLGPELREDSNPIENSTLLNQDEITDLMNSPAYTDRNHKDHAKVSARVQGYFAKKHGTEAAA